jgi:hypothetical protein
MHKQTSTVALCRAHSRAQRKLSEAVIALAKIDGRVFLGLRINTSKHLTTKSGAMIFPPLRKGEHRTTLSVATAMTHEDIDRICEAYIRFSRKEGKWGCQHDAIKGRLDDHGVFHELTAPCCPRVGVIVEHRQPGTDRPRFNKESLAAYRERIAQFHMILDEKLADVKSRNDASGYTKAADRLATAKTKERETWDALRARARTGTITDVVRIFRHHGALFDSEWRRHLRDNAAGRPAAHMGRGRSQEQRVERRCEMSGSRKTRAPRPAFSIRFTNRAKALAVADQAFSDAIDEQGRHMKSGGRATDEKRSKQLDALENRTSNEATRAWREFCRYRPQSPQELSEYLLTVLRHERVAEAHRDFQIADVPHTAHVLKNAHAALVNLLFVEAR